MWDVESAECPVSVVKRNQRLQWLIRLLAENRNVHTATGACLYGHDASKWPAIFWDAVTTEEQYRILEHNARVTAEAAELKRK